MQTLLKRIVNVRITESPQSFGDPLPEVWVRLDGDDTEQLLFKYYPDEIAFASSELVGLTVDQALELKRHKDRAFLRSEP